MSKTIMNINGADKEIKFVEVDKDKGVLKIFFTDLTFVMHTNVKVMVR